MDGVEKRTLYTGSLLRMLGSNAEIGLGLEAIYFVTPPLSPERTAELISEERLSIEPWEIAVRFYEKKQMPKLHLALNRLEANQKRISNLEGKLELIREYDNHVLKGAQVSIPSPDDSMGCHDWVNPSEDYLRRLANSIASEFSGLDRVNLYAAISGNLVEIAIAERTIELGRKSIMTKRAVEITNLDSTFKDIMERPTVDYSPQKIPQNTKPTIREIMGLIAKGWAG